MISNSHQFYAGYILDLPVDENGDWPSAELQWVGDLNNDDREDIVYITHTGYLLEDLNDPDFAVPHANLHILYSNGIGFDEQVITGADIDFVSGLDVADLDNDDLLDIVVYQTAAMPPEGDGSNYAVNQSVVWNNGSSWLVDEFSEERIAAHGGALGDINGDGLVDIFFIDETSAENSMILMNDGERDFEIRRLVEDTGSYDYQLNGAPILTGVVELMDTDFDGDLDLVFAADSTVPDTSLAGVYSLTIENVGGEFSGNINSTLLFALNRYYEEVAEYDPVTGSSPPEYLRTYLSQPLDLDGDGLEEIFYLIDAEEQLAPLVWGYDSTLNRYTDRTADFFEVTEFYKAYFDGFKAQDVARLVDYDGDGLNELFISHYGSTGFDQLPDQVINILEQGADGIYHAVDVFDYRTLIAHDVSETMPIDINGNGQYELIALDRVGYSENAGMSFQGYQDLKGEAVNLYYRDSEYSTEDLVGFENYLNLQANSDFIYGPNAKWESFLLEGPFFDGLLYGLDEYNFILSQRSGSAFDEFYQILPARYDLGDYHLARDIDGNAGTVAKILGAVFGAEQVSNKEYAGIGLSLMDSGAHTFESLGALAMGVLAPVDNTEICEILWENVAGSPAEVSDIAPFVSMLDNEELSVGELVVLAANTAQNLENIDFVGLQSTGLEYTPVG